MAGLAGSAVWSLGSNLVQDLTVFVYFWHHVGTLWGRFLTIWDQLGPLGESLGSQGGHLLRLCAILEQIRAQKETQNDPFLTQFCRFCDLLTFFFRLVFWLAFRTSPGRVKVAPDR